MVYNKYLIVTESESILIEQNIQEINNRVKPMTLLVVTVMKVTQSKQEQQQQMNNMSYVELAVK